jgi:hypothetical protein
MVSNAFNSTPGLQPPPIVCKKKKLKPPPPLPPGECTISCSYNWITRWITATLTACNPGFPSNDPVASDVQHNGSLTPVAAKNPGNCGDSGYVVYSGIDYYFNYHFVYTATWPGGAQATAETDFHFP